VNATDSLRRNLLLVRHSEPEITPGVAAREWRLSAEGRRRCGQLALALAAYAPTALVASIEPKARATAELVAARLDLAVETASGLHEHERDNAGYLAQDAFAAAMRAFFARSDELVLGRETAAQAVTRFSRAVERVLADHPTGTVAIVTHGTVLTLYVARHAGVAPYPFWRRLALPTLVTLELPAFTIAAVEDCSSREAEQR
jgi:broad specificity phosphatase PhoE